MISAGELAHLRDDAEAWLPDTCAVRGLSSTRDDQGYEVSTWTTRATVACRVAPGGILAREQETGGQVRIFRPTTITLPAETDVTERDQILVTSGICAGRAYEVQVVKARSYEALRRCDCIEVA